MQFRHFGGQAAEGRRNCVELHLKNVFTVFTDVVHHIVGPVDAQHERLIDGWQRMLRWSRCGHVK
jgi:hypothetical protein